MFRNFLNLAVFVVGLVAVCWIGVGYVGSNPLGAAVALLIGACYVAGALELHRYRQATSTLQHAVADLSVAPSSLGSFLERLHPSLRNAVRLRVEGERVALPAPSLTPYLVGLLVLLGMLGTLLGMMATLRGTGLALESATDLQAIRGSLAAPVKGLGFAFGTSIAGVATSAMLGLLSALCRRERLDAVQLLDVKIASTLRIYSQTHQREEAFKLLQQQTEAMPVLMDRLQTMVARIEQHSEDASERQRISQDAFHASTSEIYAKLAASVEQSLKDSVTESARAASAAFQPVMASTMAGLARETASLHAAVTQAVTQQLDGLTNAFETSTARVADVWTKAVAEQQRANETLAQDLRASQDRFAGTFEERSVALVDRVAARLDTTAGNVAEAWNDALAKQASAHEGLATRNEQALVAASAVFEAHASSLVRVVQTSHDDLQAKLQARDEARLTTWTDSLTAMVAALKTQWEETGEGVAIRQQDICDTLARTADDIATQTQAHASETIAEISRLVDAASEAPKAAAEIVAELRQKLSESMVRDTAMLEERSRLLATLETLLDAVNHASTEQRVAVDALVTTSADLLERVSTRFIDHIEAETGKLEVVGAQVAASAGDVASLGETFGAGVQLFGQSNEALMERLQVIATALDNSLARSDEQLAYYVAQAREVVDLSMLSQKQIIEEMQQLARQRVSATAETA
ncbi:hypothetical protein BJI69_06200 [Luteibacter rhizovicinus DSM 16549]|uniref:Uncharacterized protein n=1 Tax=Luteibacter rhizovicinus DSM 16549 TaxID=1440763 RepID=A0A0G9HGX0_9GAMM|nr:DUF802 domain-containing protein [Luteibacter rhizovicinus]APG03541.1 hypothetical protein BJI69_06200 [Luteibacter rhizovicinus DSM 16549]KLD68706.1 membrane protein [Luteibacter rhizovicinus DSM 16549]KLD73053.1 membrane protein [Xanthomonas hyacinthi DSM 19077]